MRDPQPFRRLTRIGRSPGGAVPGDVRHADVHGWDLLLPALQPAARAAAGPPTCVVLLMCVSLDHRNVYRFYGSVQQVTFGLNH